MFCFYEYVWTRFQRKTIYVCTHHVARYDMGITTCFLSYSIDSNLLLEILNLFDKYMPEVKNIFYILSYKHYNFLNFYKYCKKWYVKMNVGHKKKHWFLFNIYGGYIKFLTFSVVDRYVLTIVCHNKSAFYWKSIYFNFSVIDTVIICLNKRLFFIL